MKSIQDPCVDFILTSPAFACDLAKLFLTGWTWTRIQNQEWQKTVATEANWRKIAGFRIAASIDLMYVATDGLEGTPED